MLEEVARLVSIIKSNIKKINGEDYDGRKRPKQQVKGNTKTNR